MILFASLFAAIGASLGSFGTAFFDRKSRKESIAWPGSHCTSCGLSLRFWENIPIISWIIVRGHCARCKSSIPVMGWIWEVIGGCIGFGVGLLISRYIEF